MANVDIHIKGGTVVDGARTPRYKADVWVKGGKVLQIGGASPGAAKQTIEADGLIVAPGFVDLHTHYDAQIRWDPYCSISGWHGVTSVVLGNCGFGFVPVRPAERERSMLMMTRTEAIPFESMKAGMHWDWETIPEYMDSLERAPKGVNCIQYLPTSSLMVYVMGLEAAKTRPATEAEKLEMKRLLHEGMDAGLCGFSLQRLGRNSAQADYDGTPMVTDTMCDDDILNLAEVLRERGEGFIQITQSTGKIKDDLAFLERLAETAQRPVLHNAIAPSRKDPKVHQRSLAWLEKVRAKGLPIYGQTATVRTGFAYTLENWNLYDSSRAWRKVTTGTFEEKLAKMKDPSLRDALKAEFDSANRKLEIIQAGIGGPIRNLIVQDVNGVAELEKYIGKSLSQIGAEEDKHPIDVMLDLSVAGDLKVEFLGPNRGFNADFMAEMTTASEYTFPGVSDGGAHTKFFTGGAFTTDFLSWLVRDESKITLEEAHYRLSSLPAKAAGFVDRGELKPGLAADIVVYGLNELAAEPEWVGEIVHDFPANEWRRVKHAKGYHAIIVNGETTFVNGECTGATPGRLLRQGRG
ncbi:MAG: N-acyl-D-amino-acid deacylase family protein [Pseudomonadota bacterium]